MCLHTYIQYNFNSIHDCLYTLILFKTMYDCVYLSAYTH